MVSLSVVGSAVVGAVVCVVGFGVTASLLVHADIVPANISMANIAAILFFINNRPFLSNTIYQEPFSKSRPNSNKNYLIVRLWNFQSAPWYASFDNLTGTISIVILLAFLSDTPPILENLILVELTVLNYNDVISFAPRRDGSIVIRKEELCDNCIDAETNDEPMTLEEFLESLNEQEQRDALVHLTSLWAERRKGRK